MVTLSRHQATQTTIILKPATHPDQHQLGTVFSRKQACQRFRSTLSLYTLQGKRSLVPQSSIWIAHYKQFLMRNSKSVQYSRDCYNNSKQSTISGCVFLLFDNIDNLTCCTRVCFSALSTWQAHHGILLLSRVRRHFISSRLIMILMNLTRKPSWE